MRTIERIPRTPTQEVPARVALVVCCLVIVALTVVAMVAAGGASWG